MADEADQSDLAPQAEVDAGIEYARASSRNRTLLPCGVCHYCGTGVSSSQLFCPKADNDDACADLWEQLRKHKQEMGR